MNGNTGTAWINKSQYQEECNQSERHAPLRNALIQLITDTLCGPLVIRVPRRSRRTPWGNV